MKREATLVSALAVILASLARPGGVGAAPGPPAGGAPLTLEIAVERALAGHPTIGLSAAGGEEAREAVAEAAAGWLPALQLTGSATRSEKPYAVFPIHGFTPGEIPPFDETIYQGALSLSYTLFDGGGRGARVRQARSRSDAAQENLNATGQMLIARVLSAYLDVLSRAELLGAQNQKIAALVSERDRVRQAIDAGTAARLEFLRADAVLAAARADSVRLASSLEAAERDLARLIGSPPAEVRAGNLVEVSIRDTTLASRDSLLQLALRVSPVVSQARFRLAAARAGGAAARSERWPKVRLAGNYLGWADSKGDDASEWTTSASLSLPVFTGGTISHGIKKAGAAARGAAAQLRLAELQTEQELDRSLSGVAETRARATSLAKAVESLDEVVRIEKLALENGSGTQTDYLNGEADLFAARANLIEARNREIAARAECARVAGVLDLAWVTRTLEVRQ